LELRNQDTTSHRILAKEKKKKDRIMDKEGEEMVSARGGRCIDMPCVKVKQFLPPFCFFSSGPSFKK
jgi:hypothetical protein